MNLFNEADKYGQNKVLPTIKMLFSGATDLNIEQHFNDTSSIDIYMTATTKDSREHYYAIECKDRKMLHTKYADDGYIIEDWKVKELMREYKNGYVPIYLNSFTDDYIICWDVSKIDFDECGETGAKQFHRTTVMKNDNDLYVKNKITLKNKQAVWIGKIESSNN